ncbi:MULTISPECIES: LacI family DNA-binding transcriptional regulator [unclassified Hyphomonas]|jgi:LacI family transcriptional regulator|uniref:Alanine racemase n=3 Tax=root TaxID=1 RepID=A0A1Y5I4V0_OSTTA|nr:MULTISPECIES: LacI family DNA-binding transcriptional regulator [unclassified Hyphomonas]MAN91156.1 LacI family transcriptional regulator [Hyphomonadaceae bacterium]OUS44538.1 alanine racemase [Ostreococcus tauri]MAA82850.1 LacI family transcriptional regulator [Hyphomonas sp.]MAL42525.1 LacI family transcriptional regulator [Hyphomonas sp.]MBG67345.1 LacI family transcriptional regulator [Hyphomonas sp.]|tara:strand:+ start:2936 stop:3979 length:1044 start_codon:yes stop_codon:yes gene_type:complete
MTDGLKAHRTSGHVRPATIIDVAREAGVSFKTVSRVLNGETNVREETRLKVLEAVKTLNYRTNHNARNLRARHSHIICLFYANPSRNYIGEVQLGALQRCQAYGYSLITEDCSDNHTSLLALRAETKLAGAILTPPLSDDKNLISELENRGIPFVRIAPAEDVEHGQDVAIDDAAAAREMTEYLIGLGHRRIGFIKGADSHAQAVRRFAGYRQALEEEGISLDPDLIEDGDFAFDSGVSCSEKLLSLPDRPTAIFASNDDMAAGVLATAYRRQVNVPANLSVVGFDDTPLATTISPSLTTIYQPSRELAAEAVSMLLEEAAPTGDAPRHKLLEYKLMLRESTAAPRA